jgi:hypothetical protein
MAFDQPQIERVMAVSFMCKLCILQYGMRMRMRMMMMMMRMMIMRDYIHRADEYLCINLQGCTFLG